MFVIYNCDILNIYRSLYIAMVVLFLFQLICILRCGNPLLLRLARQYVNYTIRHIFEVLVNGFSYFTNVAALIERC